MVENLPANAEKQETRVQSQSWEDPLEAGTLQYSYLGDPMDREAQ